ncbi:MAG: hypothetical protein GEU82_17570 [Luteitalea sp.]|nr:hypothetical protein [Luteitalea sp.]
MPLRLAFDMDGVLADMEGELVRHAEQLFGTSTARRAVDPPPADVTDEPDPIVADITPPLVKLRLTPRQQRRLWHHVETVDNFWETLQEIEPGSIERLAALAAARRWEIIFLTKRPASAGVTSQRQTQRWLQAKGFTLPSVFVVRGSRGRIAQSLGLDFVIDDRPENCLDVVVDSQARAILVWREDERQLPAAALRLGIGVVKTVGECLDILAQVDTPSPDRSTVIERVLRLLGLKEPPGPTAPANQIGRGH